MCKCVALCPKCGRTLKMETDKYLRNEYLYECTYCDENFYGFEAVKIQRVYENRKEATQ